MLPRKPASLIAAVFPKYQYKTAEHGHSLELHDRVRLVNTCEGSDKEVQYSGCFGRFCLFQSEDTSIILKSEQFGIATPVNGCFQLRLRLVCAKVCFQEA